MEIVGDYTFDAPNDIVWDAIRDPEVLGSVMPGGEGFAEVAENEYTGKLKVKVGPVQGLFTASIKLSDVVAPISYTIQVDGKGAPGFVKATGKMQLEDRGAQTYISYSGDANIGGRIASVGQRLMDSTAKSIIRQSLEGLNEYLKVQVAQREANSAPTPLSSEDTNQPSIPAQTTSVPNQSAPQYAPPSQTEVTFNIMRDVFNDVVPEQMRPVLIITIILFIGMILRSLRSK